MAIEIKLVPDGGLWLPMEAADDGALSYYLEKSGHEGWRDVQRTFSGRREPLTLGLPGGMDDYQQSDLDTVAQSITSNIDGLKEHYAGWQPAEEP